MADQIYKVRDPAGNIREIHGPAGASDEEVIRQAQALLSDSPRAAPTPPTPAPSTARKDAAYSLLDMLPESVTRVLSRAPDIQGSIPGRVIQGAADMPVGAMQLGANMVGLGGPANARIAEINRTTEQQRGPDAGFDWSRLAGGVFSPANLGILGNVPRAATAAGRIGQGVAIGSSFGATAPVTQEGNYWGDKAQQVGLGGLIGGLIPGAWETSKAVGRGVRNVVDPFLPGGAERHAGRLANQLAGERAPQVISEMRQSLPIVPGSMPHAGQAAVRANSAEFSSGVDLARQADPSRFFGPTGVEGTQEAARRASLQSFGRTPNSLESAIEARATQASTDYSRAGQQVVKSDDALNVLLQRPSMDKVLGRAADLAKEKGQTFSIGRDVPEQVVPGKIIGESGVPLTQTTVPAQRTQYPVQSLHYLKMAMDDLLKNPERFGIGASEQAAIASTKRSFLDWMSQKSPAYEAARSNFAAASRPINEMQVGQQLEKALANSLGTAERPTVFANAMQNAPSTIKKATGSAVATDLSQVLQPQNLAKAQNVLKDLARNAEFEELARKGMPEARRITGVFADSLPDPNLLTRVVQAFNFITRRLEGKATDLTMKEFARLVEDPQRLARVMEAATPFERSAIMDSLNQYQAAIAGQSQRK